MRRIISVLAVGLVLLVGLGGNAFSRMYPCNFRGPHIMSDDHTWGGEVRAGASDTEFPLENRAPSASTGFMHLDAFLSGIFGQWWYADDFQAGPTTYYVVPLHHDSDDQEPQTNSNNKGNWR